MVARAKVAIGIRHLHGDSSLFARVTFGMRGSDPSLYGEKRVLDDTRRSANIRLEGCRSEEEDWRCSNVNAQFVELILNTSSQAL
jgi:hypothetical protein